MFSEQNFLPNEQAKVPVAGCLVFNTTGHLLLLHRALPTLTQWEIPGGKVESGESLRQAVRREMWEELGLTIGGIRWAGKTTFKQIDIVWEYHWFYARAAHGTVRLREPLTFDQWHFFQRNEIAAMAEQVSPNVVHLLTAYHRTAWVRLVRKAVRAVT